MNFRTWYDRYSNDCQLKYPSKATQETYLNSVGMFLGHFKDEVDPKSVPVEKIKEWLLSFETINTRNHKLCAIKSFYLITVGMPLKLDKIPFSKKDKKVPQILEEDEIQAILDVCINKKHKSIILLFYACGLRMSEVLNLKINKINNDTIDIICAKGRKDRIVPLPHGVKMYIDDYIKEYRPIDYLFNGWKNEPQYSERSISQFIKDLAVKAGITKNVHAHLFRHSYATHSLEQGTSIVYLQEILGHNNPKTTSIYLHTSRKSISKINSPANNMRF